MNIKNYIKQASKEYDEKFKVDEVTKSRSNRVTLMNSRKKQLNKTYFINENKEIDISTSFPLFYDLTEVAINDIRDMTDLLNRFSNKQNYCFTRGTPTDFGTDMHYMNREVRKVTVKKINENNTVSMPTLKDGAKNWIMVDVDNFTSNLDLYTHKNRKVAVEEFVKTLPECFHNSSYVVQYSNGMLINDNHKLKAHVFFMTEQAVYSQQIKPWLKNSSKYVDPSAYNIAQLYFTAKPFFREVQDPFENQSRLFLKNKVNSKVNLPLSTIKSEYIYNNIKECLLNSKEQLNEI